MSWQAEPVGLVRADRGGPPQERALGHAAVRRVAVEVGLAGREAVPEVEGLGRTGTSSTSVFPLRLRRQAVHPFKSLLFLQGRQRLAELLGILPGNVLHGKIVGIQTLDIV